MGLKFDNDLASLHAYLSGDGYVIKNPKHQKHKYYYIALRNTNQVLLKDFQTKFMNYFHIKPIITSDGRCKKQSKSIFQQLTKKYSYYSHEWILPSLRKNNLRQWLRSFFDCEAWVEYQIAKSRSIRLDSVNRSGLYSIKNALSLFSITSTIHPTIKGLHRLNICGLDDLQKYHHTIGFLHPEKKRRLVQVLHSYKSYNWIIPQDKISLSKFINEKGKIRKSRNETRFFSINKRNLILLKNMLNKRHTPSFLYGPWKNNTGSLYYVLIIRNAQKSK